VPDNPQRLAVAFDALRLEPAPRGGGDLDAWRAALAEHNPGMDAATGAADARLPEAPPRGWVDHLYCSARYQLVRAHLGSVTLLVRVGDGGADAEVS
jgi:hypothetical protein